MGFFKKLFKGIGKGVKGLIQGVTGMQLGDGNKAVEVKLIQPPPTPYNGEKGFGVKLLQDGNDTPATRYIFGIPIVGFIIGVVAVIFGAILLLRKSS